MKPKKPDKRTKAEIIDDEHKFRVRATITIILLLFLFLAIAFLSLYYLFNDL